MEKKAAPQKNGTVRGTFDDEALGLPQTNFEEQFELLDTATWPFPSEIYESSGSQ